MAGTWLLTKTDKLHCVPKHAPTLASCSFKVILIIFGKRHRYTSENDMLIQLFSSLHFYLLYLLLNSCNGNDAKSLLNSCCAVGRRSPSRHWWLQQLFQSSAALNDFSLTQNWKLTANTTMKFCWRSRRCQLCGALLATRLCSSKTVHLRTTLVKQSSPLSRKHRILCLQIRGRQTFIHSFIHFTIHIKTKLYSI